MKKVLVNEELLRQVLDALEAADNRDGAYSYRCEIDALRTLLDAPAVEPAVVAQSQYGSPELQALILEKLSETAVEPVNLDQIAVERYKVVPAHESMFHRWAVVAGNGTQQLYVGREVECQNMARKFAGAFLDGAYLASPPPTEHDAAYREAKHLAEALFKKHYARDKCYSSGAVEWGLCDSTAGIISQIDNMVCQLVRPADVPLLTDAQVDDLYANLQSLSMVLESSGVTDESQHPFAYPTILDAMAFVQQHGIGVDQ